MGCCACVCKTEANENENEEQINEETTFLVKQKVNNKQKIISINFIVMHFALVK